MPGEQQHVPVLLERTLRLLGPALDHPGAIYLDATLGHGGHAVAVLRAHPEAHLIGLDRDESALELSRERLAEYADRITLVHATYDEVDDVLDDLKIPAVQAILYDLGVSSMQLDQPERGFAYMRDADLDMRMDRSTGPTAADVLAGYSEKALRQVISRYGEERFAGRIAAAIVASRMSTPITTTGQLAELIAGAIPAAARHQGGGHPAKRTFQALRIEVNAELEILQRAIPAALSRLAVGGRMVVLSYHSLEDRIVKRAFAEQTQDKTPLDLPVPLPEAQPQLRLLVRGSEQANAEEIEANSRSASVRLRAVERIGESEAA
ncbi:16S rRNA (cytosine(1402)-N(4))-methyltransferase RsmH [Epidermidibacterium keratini]|uniref:Ribosomal RNA small subunit methyltransferase H n=1 Tax=Epidermidibacterium keratini TaxID=1891644 RepID=A0A7L4YKS2_9ACTN|nr:16S rRNA (cytosine(1402)-N(4))-methyltransferase RsmH [Epidermidibacterium keratini]QHB99146.1 16S rRNA (cytosine(1402)-N(4))-methyltransferase RsmH [Epidermidibacterium keratini]